MYFPVQSTLLNTLGWSLFNSLWQMAALWIVYLSITAGAKKFSSGIRHFFALLLLVTGSLWFIGSLSFNFFTAYFARQNTIGFNILTTSSFYFMISGKGFINSVLPYCSFLYLIIQFFLIIRYIKCYISSQQLQKAGLLKAPVDLRLFIDDLSARIGIRKKINLWISSTAKSPMTIGFLKPVILIPLATINHLSTHQMEAVLLHELAHIKRNDYLINLFIAVTEIIFFFNPFAVSLIHAIKKERENSCDDLVMQFRYDSYVYASALLSLEKARNMQPKLAMAATGRNNKMLLQRIMRITGHKGKTFQNRPRFILFIMIALIACLIAFIKPGKIVDMVINNPVQAVYAKKTLETKSLNFVREKPLTIRVNTEKGLLKLKNKKEKQVTGNDENEQEQTEYPSNNINNGDNLINTITTVVSIQPTDYSFTQNDLSASAPAPSVSSGSPYIPSSSFSYNEVEDANSPKLTIDEIKKETADANLVLEKPLKFKNQISLRNLARETLVNGNAIRTNIEKLEAELQKSIEQLDNNPLNDDTTISLSNADEVRLRKDLQVQIKALESLKNSNSLKARALSEQIIKQQFKLQQADLKKQQELIRKLLELNKKLKIVYI
ncbi:MAG TPA: M56 family metallopeptidase [Puia sp.]|nr:M56 family metallopeptidase [Puia sp.]